MTQIRTYVHTTPSLEDRRVEAWATVAGHYVDNNYHRVRAREESLLAYCIEGGGGLRLGQSLYHFQKGDLLLQPAHLQNTCYCNQDTGWNVRWIIFGGTYSQKMLDIIGLSPTQPILSIGVQETLIEQFQKIYGILEVKSASCHLDASRALLTLLYDILKYKKEQRLGDFNPFQHVHYLTGSVEEMAEEAGYSKHHFIRLFKKATGMTPWQYVLHLKIDKAKDLLLESRRSVKEVSNLVGIDNALYFSRLFRKMTNTSPTEFRAQKSE